jgi:MFS family permease
LFGALGSRDFRLFWFGAFISNIGSWIQSIALNWLVLQLTQSALALGVVSFAGTVPILALSLIGGDYADRTDRRVLLQVTQTLLLILAVGLAALTWWKLASIALIVGITLLTGIVTAINSPAWQTFIVDLVDDGELPTAIALNSTQFNLSRVAGPSIAGVLLAIIGAAGCFFVNGLSFLAVVGALAVIRPHRQVHKVQVGSLWTRVQAGLGYAAEHPVVRPLIVLTAVITVFGFPYALLMPVMAQQVLGLGADGYGAMMAATGVGAIVGSLLVARWGRRFPRGRFLLVAALGFSGAVGWFATSRSFPVALLALAALGFCMIAYMTTANTVIQIITPNHLRGRLMSIWTLVSFGMTPVGSLIAGAVAQQWGAPVALALGGAVCGLACVVITITSPALRMLGVASALALPAAGATRT